MSSESRAIAAFTGVGVLLVGVAIVVSRVGHDAAGAAAAPVADPSAPAVGSSAGPVATAPKAGDLPSETPEKFSPTFDGYDFMRREAEPTSPPRRSSRGDTSAWCKTSGASTAPRVTTS